MLEYFDVQEVWMNGVDSTSKVYSKLLDALLASDVETGDVFEVEICGKHLRLLEKLPEEKSGA